MRPGQHPNVTRNQHSMRIWKTVFERHRRRLRRPGALGLVGPFFCLVCLVPPFDRGLAAAEPPSPTAPQLQPEAEPKIRRGPTVAIQGGLSGLATTLEGEVALSWGLVAGAGIHGGRLVPLGPTARLAYDFPFTGRWHARLGLRLYPFAESGAWESGRPPSWSCDPCAFLVPEIGVRYVGSSGIIFEIGEPVARLNTAQARDAGFGAGLSSSGENGFLVSILVGVAHQF
jgi:hypothetical protein